MVVYTLTVDRSASDMDGVGTDLANGDSVDLNGFTLILDIAKGPVAPYDTIVITGAGSIKRAVNINVVMYDCSFDKFLVTDDNYATSYLISYNHNTVNGESCVWGYMTLATGLTKWNYADQWQHNGTVVGAGDTNTCKIVFCATHHGDGHTRLLFSAGLEMKGGQADSYNGHRGAFCLMEDDARAASYAQDWPLFKRVRTAHRGEGVNGSFMGTGSIMTWVQAKELIEWGQRLTNHTKDHEDLDDLTRIDNAMVIQYVGAAATSLLTITVTNGIAINLVTANAGGVDDLNLDLTSTAYDSLGALVTYLDGLVGYTCTLSDETDESSMALNAVAGQDIKSATYTCTFDEIKSSVLANMVYMRDNIAGIDLAKHGKVVIAPHNAYDDDTVEALYSMVGAGNWAIKKLFAEQLYYSGAGKYYFGSAGAAYGGVGSKHESKLMWVKNFVSGRTVLDTNPTTWQNPGYLVSELMQSFIDRKIGVYYTHCLYPEFATTYMIPYILAVAEKFDLWVCSPEELVEEIELRPSQKCAIMSFELSTTYAPAPQWLGVTGQFVMFGAVNADLRHAEIWPISGNYTPYNLSGTLYLDDVQFNSDVGEVWLRSVTALYCNDVDFGNLLWWYGTTPNVELTNIMVGQEFNMRGNGWTGDVYIRGFRNRFTTGYLRAGFSTDAWEVYRIILDQMWWHSGPAVLANVQAGFNFQNLTASPTSFILAIHPCVDGNDTYQLTGPVDDCYFKSLNSTLYSLVASHSRFLGFTPSDILHLCGNTLEMDTNLSQVSLPRKIVVKNGAILKITAAKTIAMTDAEIVLEAGSTLDIDGTLNLTRISITKAATATVTMAATATVDLSDCFIDGTPIYAANATSWIDTIAAGGTVTTTTQFSNQTNMATV